MQSARLRGNMEPQKTIGAAPPILSSRPTCNGDGDEVSSDKRKPVRRNPERRRQQNIQAQKKYRQKLKKRLDHLETLAASVGESNATYLKAIPGAGLGVDALFQSEPSSITAIQRQTSCHHMDPSLNEQIGESSVDFSDLNLSASISPNSSSDITLWSSTTSIDPSHLIEDKDTGSQSQYWLDVDCGCLKPHIQISPSQPKEYRDLPVLNISPGLFSADPYVNSLRIERLCIVQAIFSNCLHIGITEDMFCDDDAISPFFRPGCKTFDDSRSDGVVATIQSMFKSLNHDVRPIKEQITTKHSPVIDVLPFPTLRRNLIQSGDAVDEDELYDDLLNGLVCWGGTGVGRRDRNCSTGSVSTGAPWDGRSWEARNWFLQKYWALLGGEDGELVRQSEWWRNIRGDETGPWQAL